MVILGILGGLVLGLAFGGRLGSLLDIRLRWMSLIFLTVVARYGTEAAIRYGFAPAEALRLPLYGGAFLLLAWALWLNRDRPGLLVASSGVLANGLAVVLNGGRMPVWLPALRVAGLSESDLVRSFHGLLPNTLGADFLLHGGPFGDVIPIPIPGLNNVASVGDAFIAVGLGWFLFATMVHPARYVRTDETTQAGGETQAAPVPAVQVVALGRGAQPAGASTPAVRPETGLAAASVYTGSTLGSPMILGGGAAGLTAPAVFPRALPSDAVVTQALSATGSAVPSATYRAVLHPDTATLPAVAVPRPPLGVRVAGHPYVRLALDARFSAMWIGQLISLFGDRLNQVALGVLVLGVTGSPLDVGLVFLSATLPNLLVGSIAGTFVDRWNQQRVMIVSDLLRAGLVLLVPLAAQVSIYLTYPVVFLVTTVSLFFRPARAAVLPRIVRTEDLTAANGATWTGETVADIAGYPLAGLFVSFLGSSLAIAFWCDAASYLLSAMLLASITIPPVARTVAPALGSAMGAFRSDLLVGVRFLRHESALFANTMVSAAGQLTVGAVLALTVVYAHDVLDGRVIGYPASYAAIDTAIGLGNLVGGFAIGAVGARLHKGPLVIGGYLLMGLATIALGATNFVVFALVWAAVIGVANMAFVIPSQTLFAERTPADLMGRVIGIRSSIVFGAFTLAMAVAGWAAEVWGAGVVLMGFGAITALSGLAACALPAVRDT